MLAVCILMRGRDEINNALAAGASYLPRARPIFPSPFPFLAPATQATNMAKLEVASTRHHRARLVKYYPRQPCVPIFVKARMLRPLQTHFLLFQQIFFVLVCIHPGDPRVPPRVLASGPKPCGGNNFLSKQPERFSCWYTLDQ